MEETPIFRAHYCIPLLGNPMIMHVEIDLWLTYFAHFGYQAARDFFSFFFFSFFFLRELPLLLGTYHNFVEKTFYISRLT